MSLHIGTGFSIGGEAYSVGVNASQDAFGKIKDVTPVFGLVFASASYDQEQVASGVRSVFEDVPFIGASSVGEMVEGGVVNQDAVVVLLVCSEERKAFSTHSVFLEGVTERKVGIEAAKAIRKELGGTPDLSFVFSDTLSEATPHAFISAFLKESKGPLVGAGAADGFDFTETYQHHNGKVKTNSAVFAGIRGKLRCGIGTDHGLLPAGTPHTVTRARGVHVEKINDEPALMIYREYFGYEDLQQYTREPLGKLSSFYPLGFRYSLEERFLTVRTPLFLESDGSLRCSDVIPEGSKVQIMIGGKEEALESVREATERAQKELGDSVEPSLAIVISGAGRKRPFGSDLNEEIQEVCATLGRSDIPTVGLYSYGTMTSAPPVNDEHAVFQDCSITVCLIA